MGFRQKLWHARTKFGSFERVRSLEETYLALGDVADVAGAVLSKRDN